MINAMITRLLNPLRHPSQVMERVNVVTTASIAARQPTRNLDLIALIESGLPPLPPDIVCGHLGLPKPPAPQECVFSPPPKATLNDFPDNVMSIAFDQKPGAVFCPLTFYNTDVEIGPKTLKAIDKILPSLSPLEGMELITSMPPEYSKALIRAGSVPQLILALLPDSPELDLAFLPPLPSRSTPKQK